MTSAPAKLSVIQVKVADRLLVYPAGRSAMVWYGAGPCAEVLSAARSRIQSSLPGERILWRYFEADDAVAECKRQLRRFQTRFGALPRLCTEGG